MSVSTALKGVSPMRFGPPTTLAEASEDWLSECGRNGVRPVTIDSHRRVVSQLPDLWPPTKESINHWRDQIKTLKPATIRLRLGVVRRFLQWGVDEGYLIANPLASVKPPKKAKPKPDERTATEEEISRMLRVCRMSDWWDHRLATMIRVACNTGLRSGEVCGLYWRDLEWDVPNKGVITVKLFQTKDEDNGDRAYITAKAVEHLRNWRTRQEGYDQTGPDNPIFPTARVCFDRRHPEFCKDKDGDWQHIHPKRFHGDVAALGRRAGLRKMYPHMFRHYAGTQFYTQTGDIEAVKNFMRHSGYEMTQAYVATVRAKKHMLEQLQRARLGDAVPS